MRTTAFKILLVFMCISPWKGYAQTTAFEYTYDGITFKITPDTNGDGYISGTTLGTALSVSNISLPSSATYNGKTYPITSIYKDAFKDCISLTGTLTIPPTVKKLEENSFYGTGITDVVLSENLTYVGRYALGNCKSLKTIVTIPKSVGQIWSNAFKGSAITGVVFNEGLTSIGANAFENCTGLITELNFPSTLTRIDGSAFKGCTNIPGHLNLNTGKITSIGANAFQNCSSLTKLTLPENSGFTTIAGNTFNGCSKLGSENDNLYIPSNITSIGASAFYNCSGFRGILTLPSSLTTLTNSSVFGKTKFKAIDARALSTTSLNAITTISRANSSFFQYLYPYTVVYLPSGVTKVASGQENFVVGAVCEKFVVYDRHSDYISGIGCDYPILTEFTATSASYANRSAFTDSDCYTSYLPYPTAVPTGMTAYTIKELSGSDIMLFSAISGSTLEANTPYLLRLNSGVTSATYATESSVLVPETPADIYLNPNASNGSGWQFLGTTENITNTVAAEKGLYVLEASNTWRPVLTTEGAGYVHSMRAFMKKPLGSNAPSVMMLLDESDTTTGISALHNSVESKGTDIYTLEGRYVGRDYNALPKGLYVVGGKKMYKF